MLDSLHLLDPLRELRDALRPITSHPLADTYWAVLAAPATWCVTLAIVVLQRFIPARPAIRTFSVGLVQDSIYFVLSITTHFVLATTYVWLLRTIYDEYLSFLTITPLASLPEMARMGIAVVVSDFVFWLHHYVRHAVPWFWEFHAVHHSQHQLNVFSDDRYHFVDYLVELPFNVFILSMFTVSGLYIVYFQVGRKWYTRLYHSNVRTNMGLLRYVFVTPQSHRVHHSVEQRHFDTNFGVMFSFWDRLFGTQYTGYDEYPDTGVPDPSFPHPSSTRGVFSTFVAQHLHPFVRIARRIGGGAMDSPGEMAGLPNREL